MRTPDLQPPAGAVEVPGSDPTQYRIGPVLLEVRRHSGTLDVVLHNTGQGDVDVPGLLLRWDPRCPVAWLSGSTGMVVEPEGTTVWRMLSGWCIDVGRRRGGPVAQLFGESVRLGPGQRVWSRWRVEDVRGGFPLPGWVPRQRYLPEGEALEFTDPDVALTGEDLDLVTTGTTTWVQGVPGLHRLAVHGPGGVTGLEIGWYPGTPQLVAATLADAEAGIAADVEAWLLSWLLGRSSGALDERLLDQLDVAVAAGLEEPTMFGVLAALRASATTELPLQEEALRSARSLLAGEPEPDEAAFVLVAALLCGHPEVAAESPRGLPQGSSLELIRHLEYGLPSSVAPGYTARDVARAQLWLTVHPDSTQHVVLGETAAAARARLLCGSVQDRDPLDIAWLLLAEMLVWDPA